MIALVLIVSHLLGDFVFQSSKMAENKESNTLYVLQHTFIHLILSFLLMLIVMLIDYRFDVFSWQSITALLITGISHFLIDRLLKPLMTKLYKGNYFFIFITDQIIHFLAIVIAVMILTPNYLFGNLVASLYGNGALNKELIIGLSLAAILILLTTFTGQLISKLFMSLNQENEVESKEIKIITKESKGFKEEIRESIIYPTVEVNDYGKWIGYFERIIIFTLIILGAYEGILIVVALKTFSRFKQLNEKTFVEKYLLGTLFSVMMALLLGVLFGLIIK